MKDMYSGLLIGGLLMSTVAMPAFAERPVVNFFGYKNLYVQSTELRNRQFQYDFGEGQLFDIVFNADGQMTWTISDPTKNSPGAPATETEQPVVYTLGQQQFMVIWPEQSGIVVTQNVDLKHLKVLASRAIPATADSPAQVIIAQAKIHRLSK